MYKAVILPLAKQDIKEAATWYNARQSGLGKRYTTHVRKTVHYICQNPDAVAIRYDSVRTVLIDTFPYMIHFTTDHDKKIITVIAILHTARDPEKWKGRE
jgi:plasmid stabilization system protein ParE